MRECIYVHTHMSHFKNPLSTLIEITQFFFGASARASAEPQQSLRGAIENNFSFSRASAKPPRSLRKPTPIVCIDDCNVRKASAEPQQSLRNPTETMTRIALVVRRSLSRASANPPRTSPGLCAIKKSKKNKHVLVHATFQVGQSH